MATPPNLGKIEAELAYIKSMLETLTKTKQEEEPRWLGAVPVRDMTNIFAPWGRRPGPADRTSF